MTLPQALSALAAAGRIKSPWLAGMALTNDVTGDRCRSQFGRDEWPIDPHGLDEWSPDLTDPATVGALTALLREATGRDNIYVSCTPGGSRGAWVWFVADPLAGPTGEPDHPFGWPDTHQDDQDTEGQAVAAALIALAEGV